MLWTRIRRLSWERGGDRARTDSFAWCLARVGDLARVAVRFLQIEYGEWNAFCMQAHYEHATRNSQLGEPRGEGGREHAIFFDIRRLGAAFAFWRWRWA
eukprot:687344-Prymnesium_polylepis.1